MSNAIATLSMQLGLDTREFTKGVTATSKEIRTVKQIMTDTQTPLERLQAQLAGIESLRQKFGTVPEERWARAIRQVQEEYQKTEMAAHEANNARGEAGDPFAMAGGKLTDRFPLIAEMKSAAAAVGPAGVAIAGAFAVVATAATGAVVAVKELTRITFDGIARLDEMADSAKALGMEASAFQQLQIAATLADAPAEELFKVIGKMEQILGDPPEEAVKAFDKLGLRISTLREMGPKAFEVIAEKISELPTRAEKFAVMADVFGKVDKRMIGLVDNFDEFMTKADGFTLEESQFGAIDEADNAMKELSAATTHLADTLAVELAPIVAEVATAISDFLQQDPENSPMLRGIVLLRNAINDTMQAMRDVSKESSGDGGAMKNFGNLLTPHAKLLNAYIIEPYIKASNEQAKLEAQVRADAERRKKEAEELKGASDAGLGAGESNAKDKAAEKAAKDAEKRDAERFQKFSDSLDKLHAEAMAIGGDPMEKMRLEAEAAGAKGEADIAAYIEAKKEIDRLKESEADLKAVQADRAKQAEKDAADFAKFMEESLSPQEKAMEKMRRAMELGIPEVALDKLAGDLASGLTKGIANAPEAVALQKGSREAASFLAKSSKEERQLKATEQMRDYLKTIAAKDTSVVVEEVGIP